MSGGYWRTRCSFLICAGERVLLEAYELAACRFQHDGESVEASKKLTER